MIVSHYVLAVELRVGIICFEMKLLMNCKAFQASTKRKPYHWNFLAPINVVTGFILFLIPDNQVSTYFDLQISLIMQHFNFSTFDIYAPIVPLIVSVSLSEKRLEVLTIDIGTYAEKVSLKFKPCPCF